MTIRYALFDSRFGEVLAIAHDRGSQDCISSARRTTRSRRTGARRRASHDAWPVLAETRRQLGEYEAGRRVAFDLPLDLAGTDFQRRVWAQLLEIPFGQTRSYAEVARAAGSPRGMAAAGAAIGRNPGRSVVPCHRVVGSDGSLTGYTPGASSASARCCVTSGCFEPPMTRRDVADMLLLAALWGGSFLFMRIAAPQFGAFALMALRTGIGPRLLLPVRACARGQRPSCARTPGRIAWIGLLNSALPFVMLGYAMQHLDAGFASILNATTPFWGAIVAFLWLGERLGRLGVVGLMVGFGGVLVLVGGRDGLVADGAIVPILASLVATASYGVAATATRKQLGHVSTLVRAAGSQMFAALLLLPFALAWWPSTPPDALAWLSVALMGVLCTGLAYLLFFRLIARIGSNKTITVTFLIPAFGMLWGSLFLGETISASMLAGAATILVGTALTTGLIAPGRRAAAAAAAPSAPAAGELVDRPRSRG